MRSLRGVIVLGLLLGGALPTNPLQLEARQSIEKGQVVGVKITGSLWKVDGFSMMTSVNIYAVEIREEGGTTLTAR